MTGRFLRKKGYNQSEQVVRATYPKLFAPIDDLIERLALLEQEGLDDFPEVAQKEVQD